MHNNEHTYFKQVATQRKASRKRETLLGKKQKKKKKRKKKKKKGPECKPLIYNPATAIIFKI